MQQLLLISLSMATLVLSYGQKLEIQFDKMVATVPDNPYIKEVTTTLEDEKTVTMFMSVTKPLDDNVKVATVLSINGDEVVDNTKTICEAFDDQVAGKDFAATSDKPVGCPIEEGDYKFDHFSVKEEKIPNQAPEGEFVGTTTMTVEGDTLFKLEYAGQIVRK